MLVSADEPLTVSDLTISFESSDPLFSPLSFSAKPGEILALIGPSGVGKTSILRAISGLMTTPIVGGGIRAENPSIVFQEDRLLPWCDLLSNTIIPIALERTPTSSDIALARGLLDRLGLASAERKVPGEISGGMRQRVAIARALVRPSPVLLLDEPFTALDFDIKIECQRVLIDHVLHQKVACILVTHDIDDAVSLASDIIRISTYPGTCSHIPVVWQGKPKDPLVSRQTMEHFRLVRGILSDGL